MPIYAYKCEACGFSKDALQKLSDDPLVDCPSCGAQAFQKQLTAAGFQLKGSGWYVTDFRDGKKNAPAGDKAESDKAVASGDAASSNKDADSTGVKPASEPASGKAETVGVPGATAPTRAAPAPAPVAAAPAPAPARPSQP